MNSKMMMVMGHVREGGWGGGIVGVGSVSEKKMANAICDHFNLLTCPAFPFPLPI